MADRPAVALVGSGRLRDAIAAALGGAAELSTADVVVAATDGWDRTGGAAARTAAAGRSWLPVGTEPGRALVGPLEVPGRPGCVECARRRRELAREHRAGWAAVLAAAGAGAAESGAAGSGVLSPVGGGDGPDADGPGGGAAGTGAAGSGAAVLAGPAAQLTALAAATVGALAAAEALAATPPRVLVVRLADLAVSTHLVLPDPTCPVCGGLPADDPAAAAELAPRSRPKPRPDTYRVGALDPDHLRRTYVDPEFGLVRRLTARTEAGLAVGRAPLGVPGGPDDAGWGRGRDARSAELVALLEALERYGGARPGGRRTTVRAPYPEVAECAVDPTCFGLHAPEQRDEPGHRYPAYDPAAPRRWVWAYSFRRRGPALVPESLAYYRTRLLHPDDPPLAYETSNGCALGGCPEEAVLHGLLEVLERDAFLLTWHAELPAPALALETADPLARLLATEIEQEYGYAVHAFDTTAEHGIPCVWVLAEGPPGGPGPATASAAGAHLDPARALRSALAELGPILGHLRRDFPGRAARAAELAADPAAVTEMEDHALLHGSPAARDRFDFLLPTPAGPGPRTPPGPAGPDARTPPEPAGDLREDLLAAVGRVLDAGLDVLAVDQTTPEHRAGGLSCVKVLVPGMLPMTFGHAHRRLALPRLHTARTRLGHPPAPVRTLPHPFP